jgi:long-chain fatty acid transport protein
MNNRRAFKLRALPLAILAFSPALAQASSFQIMEQSPAHLGHAFAGTASNIEDASTVFFNPAGMSQLEGSQVTAAGNVILTEANFNDQDSNTGGTSGHTEEVGLVPNLYYVQPLTERWTLGLGINAPFGLKSDYERDWIGRYLATKSELEVVNINGTLSFAVNDRLSLALGLNYQDAEVTLENAVDSTLGVNPDPATDSYASIIGNDTDVILDLSVYLQVTDATSLGMTWRQGADFSLSGDARFERNAICAPGEGFPTGAPPAPTTGSLCAGALNMREGLVVAEVTLPSTLTLSLSQQLTPEWTLHGDLAWTEWSEIGSVGVINTGNDAEVDRLDLEYDDTMRYALGVTYHNQGPWTWRFGAACDEAPQTDPNLVTPRIPDGDRTWVSVGIGYEFSEAMSIDVGYAHLFIDDVDIHDLNTDTGHRVSGNFDPRVDIIGVQGNWRF